VSKADVRFIEMCSEILLNGEDSTGQIVRPKWEDGTPAHTKSISNFVSKYDLSKEFPALTLRPTNIKAAFDEILWIWQKKSNNIKDLNSRIWDEWADENGTIGKAYGYQLGIKYDFGNGRVMDQVDNILWQLKNTPKSRRMLTNIYNFSDLPEMGLEPCCYATQWEVKKDRLDLMLIQRSQDTLVANNWNVVQYALLQMMFAQVSGLRPGILTHVIGDAHIYDRHIPLVKDLIQRERYDAPYVTLNPRIDDFYAFIVDDLSVIDYKAGEQLKNIPVAV
jgi:thymidylate synthase